MKIPRVQNPLGVMSIILVVIISVSIEIKAQDGSAEDYLLEVNKTFSRYGNLEMEARWAYVTNISDANEEAMVSL